MPLRVCAGCSTRYAAGLDGCPHCGADDKDNRYDWEEDVANEGNRNALTSRYPEDDEAAIAAAGSAEDVPEDEPYRGEAADVRDQPRQGPGSAEDVPAGSEEGNPGGPPPAPPDKGSKADKV